MERKPHFLDEHVEKLRAAGELFPERKAGTLWYNRDGDCVVYLSVNEGVVADRIDEYLTLYHSAVDERVIGFQLKGIRAMMDEFDFELASVRAEIERDEVRRVTMNMMLLRSLMTGPDTRQRLEGYAEAATVFDGSPREETYV